MANGLSAIQRELQRRLGDDEDEDQEAQGPAEIPPAPTKERPRGTYGQASEDQLQTMRRRLKRMEAREPSEQEVEQRQNIQAIRDELHRRMGTGEDVPEASPSGAGVQQAGTVRGVSSERSLMDQLSQAEGEEPGGLISTLRALMGSRDPATLEQAGKSVMSASETVFDMFHPAARMNVEAAASETTLGALANVGDLLAEISSDVGLEDVAAPIFTATEEVRVNTEGMSDTAERMAKELGMKDSAITASRAVGHVTGFTANMTGAYKAAGAMHSLGSTPGMYLTDFLAGTVYGFAGREGGLGKRLSNAAEEGALWTIIALPIAGTSRVLKSRRNKRLAELWEKKKKRVKLQSNIDQGLIDPETGVIKPRNVDGDVGADVMKVMSEEEVIGRSGAAQRVYQRQTDKHALIAGIQDLNRSDASHGVVEAVEDVDNMVQSFREEFPNLTFHRVRREDGKFDVIFGKQGMKGSGLGQYKKHGYFPGQRVQKSGNEYEYVRGPDSNGNLVVRRVDSGNTTTIKEEGATKMSFGTNPADRTPEVDALLDDFEDWLTGRMDEISSRREDLWNEEIVRRIRQGEMSIDEFRPRDFGDDASVVRPEAHGVSPRDLAEREADDARKIILQEGLEDVHLVKPEGPATFSDLAEEYARQRGLSGQDLDVFLDHAGVGIRRRMWDKLPDEEAELLEGLRAEVETILDEASDNLDMKARFLGFDVERLPQGKVQLRDINTNAPWHFESEQAALEGLDGAQRTFLDKGRRGGLPPFAGAGSPDAMGAGGAKPEGVFLFEDESIRDVGPNMVPSTSFTNIRDWLLRIEQETGIPFWSRAFEDADEALQGMRNDMVGWSALIDDALGDLSRKEAVQIGRWWRELEAREIAQNSGEARKIAKEMGLSPKQIKAAKEARNVWNTGFLDAGMDEDDFIQNYYGRIQPYFEKTGDPVTEEAMRQVFPDGVPKSVQPFFKHMRTGEMSRIEKDPRLVMMKWFRAKEFENHLGGIWQKLEPLTDKGDPLQLSQLSSQKRQEVLQALGGQSGVEQVRKVLGHYMQDVRGFPDEGVKGMRRIMQRITNKTGMNMPPELLEQYANTWMSAMYGSAINSRPQLFLRNTTQNLWFSYSRIGGEFAESGLKRALSPQGFIEALEAGAIRSRESGVPMGELITTSMLENQPIRGTTLPTKAVALALRGATSLSQVTRRISRKSLALYSSADDLNRAWAFHWKRQHVASWLDKKEAGEVGFEKFVDEAFPFDSEPVIREFANRLEKFGRDEALDFIGKVFADENHFIYGASSQPMWMQSTFGRFMGMFGTWPIWAKEMYMHRVRHGSFKNIAKFMGRTTALMGAFGITAYETGIDLWDWMAPTSMFGWAGGPALDPAIAVKNIIQAPRGDEVYWAKQALSDIGRISYPYQGLVRDVSRGLEADNPAESAISIMLGRPERGDELHHLKWNIKGSDLPMFQRQESRKRWHQGVQRWKNDPDSWGSYLPETSAPDLSPREQ